jgi:hypothetical protein
VAELTGLLDLGSWPEGMRVIVRKQRPHPGAQLRFTDIDGHPFHLLDPKGSAVRKVRGTHHRRMIFDPDRQAVEGFFAGRA